MKTPTRQLCWLLWAALSACTPVPPLPQVPLALPENYPQGADGPGSPVAAIGWQTMFAEPRLRSLIEVALANNADLKLAALRIEEARARYGIQLASAKPSLALEISGERARIPAAVNRDTATLGSSHAGGLRLASYELDVFGRLRSLNQAALERYLGTEEAALAVRISLIADVAKAYFSERAYAEQLELARQTLAARETYYELLRKSWRIGAISSLELSQNEALLQSARVSSAALTRLRDQAENALQFLVGAQPDGLPAPRSLSEQALSAELPAGLPSALLRNRPDIRAAEHALRAANADIGAARAAFFPRISLTAAGGVASNSLTSLFSAAGGAWSFASVLTMPLFDGGRNQANLDVASVNREVAIVGYQRAIQSAFREVADALAARAPLEEQVRAQADLLRAEQRRLKLTEQRQRFGAASSFELIDARRDAFQAQQDLLQARSLRLANLVDLFRALGGGIEP